MKITAKDQNKTIIVNRLDIMLLSKSKFKNLLHKFGKIGADNNYNIKDALLILPKKNNGKKN